MTGGPWDFSDEPPESHDDEWLQPWEEASAWSPPTWEDVEEWCGPEFRFWRDELDEEEE